MPVLASFGGCGTVSSFGLGDRGARCDVATDCAAGLICVAQKSGDRACTDDVSTVTGKPPSSGGTSDAEAPVEDASSDAGGEPGKPDAGPEKDAGHEPLDAGPEKDAGHSEDDAGPPDGGEPDADVNDAG